ncbi:MAG: patatin-like phospholipase family protein, partial [Actinomycetes bacterium]
LVLTKANSGVPVMRAAAASASVPGIFSPQPIGDRKCVDGGVAGSATHSDVVAGAERVLVLPLAAGVPAPGMYCQQPDSLARELDDLRSSGSEVELRVPDLPTLTTAELMSPSAIPIAMAAARTQAAGDLPALVEFWSR